GQSILADSGTEQLEFIVLSQRTGDPRYQQKVILSDFLFNGFLNAQTLLIALGFKFKQMDELACFVPGMLALGSSDYDPEKAEKFLSLAKEVLFLQTA
ncbi:hypothetical protein BHE74_00048541, partial [Ensete ventricosum]